MRSYCQLRHNRRHASLAQRLEHLSCKQGVVGSIPTGGSILLKAKRSCGWSTTLVIHLVFQVGVAVVCLASSGALWGRIVRGML